MKTTVERVSDSVAVIGLDGELDASNYQDLITTGQGLYGEGVRTLVLDLAALEYMASSGHHRPALAGPRLPRRGTPRPRRGLGRLPCRPGRRRERQPPGAAPARGSHGGHRHRARPDGDEADPADLPGSLRSARGLAASGSRTARHGVPMAELEVLLADPTLGRLLDLASRCGRRCPDRPDRHRGPAPRRGAGVGRGQCPPGAGRRQDDRARGLRPGDARGPRGARRRLARGGDHRRSGPRHAGRAKRRSWRSVARSSARSSRAASPTSRVGGSRPTTSRRARSAATCTTSSGCARAGTGWSSSSPT